MARDPRSVLSCTTSEDALERSGERDVERERALRGAWFLILFLTLNLCFVHIFAIINVFI